MKEIKNANYQVTEVQLVYKTNVRASDRFKIQDSKSAYNLLKQIWDDDNTELREEFKIILLNRANKVLGYFNVSVGGVSGTLADPKLIFASALKGMASGIILAHNHPSGNLKPSEADFELTKKLKEGGRLLEIQVLDHIILTSEGYYSFADEGLI